MNSIILFLDWIFWSYFHSWGIYLFESLESIWLLVTCQTLILFVLFVIFKKLFQKKTIKVILLTFFILLNILFVDTPFCMVQKERRLLDIGQQIIAVINKTREEKTLIPKSIEEIESKFNDDSQKKAISEHFIYKNIDHFSYNKKQIRPSDYLYEDSFTLTINAWYLWNNHYYFSEKTSRFELTDK